jgi:dihydrofolate reductase
MRKVIWLMHTSVDGFVAGPKGELDWAGANMDDELWQDVWDLLGTVDAALFGRRTYQDFENYWPAVAMNPSRAKNELDFSRWIDKTTKIVASTTLRKLDWENSTLLNENVAEGVARMKEQPGNNLLLFGSPGLASHLMRAKLIDELRIDVHPITLGTGRTLFSDATARHKVTLVQAKTFQSGVVGLRYDMA